MLFGKNKEKIEIHLEENSFSPGETIRGKIALKLDKPMQAKSLNITLIGQALSEKQNIGVKTDEGKFDFLKEEIKVDGKKEYYIDIYPFEIKIPENALLKAKNWKDQIPALKLTKDLLDSDIIKPDWHEEYKWYIEARLVKKLSIDIKKKEKININ